MQKPSSPGSPSASPEYRERLTPSLWTIVGAAVIAPMVALVAAPIDTTLALVIGVLVGAGIVALMIAASPAVRVTGATLIAGRARIDTAELGSPREYHGDEARFVRGPGLGARAWHLIRGGIDGVVVVPVTDPDDPTPEWVISTRTPDRLAAAIRRSQDVRPRTPHR